MGVKVVGDKDNLFCPWIQSVRSVLEYLRKIQCCSGRERIKFPVFSIFQWNSHIHICYCAYGYSTGNFCIQGNLRTIPCSCSVLANIAYTNYSAKPSGLRHNGFPPACQWLTDHEYICDSVADIHGIHLFRMPRFTWDALFLYKNLYSQALNAVWPGLLPPCRVKKS